MVQSPRNSAFPRQIGELLGSASSAADQDTGRTLGGLYQAARQLSRLQALLARHSDPEMAGQFQVANVRQDRLILVTPTASWATRLRMQAPQFIDALQSNGIGQIRHIDIRVAPLHRESGEERSRRSLSPAAKLALEQMKRLTSES